MRVRCNYCGGIYDLGKVTVVERYADCSVFLAPCCGRKVDDRKWVSFSAFSELPGETGELGWRRY